MTGGIIALGISTNQWSISKCTESLISLAKQVFRPKSHTAWLGTSFQKMIKYVKLAACAAWKSSIIDSSTIDSVYQLVFGEEASMMLPKVFEFSPTRVAVTTYSIHDSACSLITTYNRPVHNQHKLYQWLQSDDSLLDIKIWEA